MKRLNPLGSLFGILLTSLLIAGLGFSLFINRGLAFNPGKLTSIKKYGVAIQGYASHAEFEKQCSYCHEPLRADLATKCESCHIDILQQVKEVRGVHSQIDQVNNCAACHSEHRGRTFNPTMTAYNLYDHSKTSFSLYWHQHNFDTTPMQCSACHDKDNFSLVDNQTCLSCHKNHDDNFPSNHVDDFGSNCQGCHEGTDRMQKFNHKDTGFQLEFKHAQARCTDCHTTENLSDASSDCVTCHAEPAIHQGLFTQSCDSCHTQENWSSAQVNNKSFSHLENASFSLDRHQKDYSDQAITCMTCHPNDIKSFDIQICLDCHRTKDNAFITEHLEQFGSDCLTCHDGVDRLSNFDHNNFFPLDGKHGQIQCADCHADKAFKGTSSECWQCHKEPEIHAGVFGNECDYCHGVEAWSPARLEQHQFPINHGAQDQKSQLTCDTCHTNNYTEYTCYNCHEHATEEVKQKHQEKNIPDEELPLCAKCHPTGREEGD